jgi:hypothetical protein
MELKELAVLAILMFLLILARRVKKDNPTW